MPGSTRQTSPLQVEQAQAAHQRAVHPLSAEERLYSRLVNSLGGIVWEADPRTFQFTFVSSQAERILGYAVTQWSPGICIFNSNRSRREMKHLRLAGQGASCRLQRALSV